MEVDNDLEVTGSPTAGETGSPTAGENGFVHIESVDSAPMDEGSIDQVERLEQDDGVVVTGVDAIQDEPHEVRTTEEVVPDEFVDCPDDLVSNEARSPSTATRVPQLPFGNATRDTQEITPVIEREILPQDNQEEKGDLIKEVSNLHHLLKSLSKQQTVTEGIVPIEGGEMSLNEMVNECSKLIEISLNEQSHADAKISELNAILHMKDKEIEDLMVMAKTNEQSVSQDVALKLEELSSVEDMVDRILYSFASIVGDSGLTNVSLSGKLTHLDKGTTFLLENYQSFNSLQKQFLELQRKELELTEKNTNLEYHYGQFMEQINKSNETIQSLNTEIERLKGEVEQEKIRYTNSKEKLSLAVTKGKALVQQRDQLKQTVSEKTSELERCLTELQEKSTALEASEIRNNELMQTAYLANSLQEALSQRDMVLQRCGEILLLSGASNELQSSDIIEGVTWLANERSKLVALSVEFERLTYAYNLANEQSFKLQDENHATMEAARVQIDHLTASFLEESLKKCYLEHECEDLATKYEGLEQKLASNESSLMEKEQEKEQLEKIQNLLYVRDQESKLYEQILEEEKMSKIQLSEELHGSKDEKNMLQINLQRSEEKASLLREKLSMAVKKGKGLVQERENMKQQLTEKNGQIEALTIDLQRQESTVSEYRNQIAKLESDFVNLQEEKGQLEQYLYQSNTMLQQVLETVDGIVLPVDVKDPVEKLNWLTTYLSEFQVSKSEVEKELVAIKDEAGLLTSKLTEALTTVKSLEDAVSVSNKNLSQIDQEKRELEISKTQSEQEVNILNEEIATLNKKLMEVMTNLKSFEDKVSNSEKTIFQLTEEKRQFEDELHKIMEKASLQTNSLQEALSHQENHMSVLVTEKEKAQVSKDAVEMELQNAYKTIKLLEDSMSELKTNVSQFSQEKEKVLDSRSELESEIKKLKEEGLDASRTIKTLQDALVKMENSVSDLVGEKKKCEMTILTLESEINSYKQEFGNLQVLLKDGSLLSLFKESFEKKIDSLKEIDQVLKDINGTFPNHPAIEESIQLSNFVPGEFDNDWNIGTIEEFNAEDSEGIVGKALDNLNTRNKILTDQFGSFSTLIDDMIESLLTKLEVIRNTMPSMVNQTKELQSELEKIRSVYNKAKEEHDAVHVKVSKLETELEASGNMCKEMSFKLEDYRVKEDNWNEREIELSAQSTSSVKDHDIGTENSLLSPSQIESLFNKITGITIPFPNTSKDTHLHDSDSDSDSDPVKKLFYILNNVNQLQDQITTLSHSKQELLSTLSRHALEVENLKGELSVGLQTIIQKVGGDDSIGVKKPADVAGLVPVLDRLVQGVVLDSESSRFKLTETERVKLELENRVKLLEDYIENRTGVQEKGIQERGVFEPPSLPAGSEISEIEDQSPGGKAGLPLVPSAAHVRSLRKGSNEQLAITIDSESDRLIEKSENDGEKGRIFKSLNTSGLVPIQGKMFADRIDGIWVSGDRALMRRPRVRLGLIAYWLLLHLWLLGTIL